MAVEDSSHFPALDQFPGLLVERISPLVEHDSKDPVSLGRNLIHLLYSVGIHTGRLLAEIVESMLKGIDSIYRMIVVGAGRNHGIHLS